MIWNLVFYLIDFVGIYKSNTQVQHADAALFIFFLFYHALSAVTNRTEQCIFGNSSWNSFAGNASGSFINHSNGGDSYANCGSPALMN